MWLRTERDSRTDYIVNALVVCVMKLLTMGFAESITAQSHDTSMLHGLTTMSIFMLQLGVAGAACITQRLSTWFA
jgi:hypothetical protein